MSVPASLIQDFIDLGLHLLYALIILGVGMRLVKPLCRRFANSRLIAHLDPSTANFLCNSSRLVLRAAVIVIAALVLGIPGSAFITVFGSAGVAIGLALQGSLSNLAGGLMLMFFRPFNVGDFIKTGDHQGTVQHISMFYTTILSPDNSRIVLPNGALTNDTLINFSAESKRQIILPFSVSYDSDPELVRRILLEEAQNNPLVIQDPAPVAPMTAHGDSALEFTLRVWTAKENFGNAKFALLESVKQAFDREGISIPYPQMDIHMKN